MLSNKRRLYLTIISVSIGTFLAALMLMSRKGALKVGDYATLFFNMLFAVGILIGIGIVFRRKNKGQH